MQTRTKEITDGMCVAGEMPLDHADHKAHESIMLYGQRAFYYTGYQKLVGRYQSSVEAKGGVDATIKIIEDRLIDSILASENEINNVMTSIKAPVLKHEEKKAEKKPEQKESDADKRKKIAAIVKKVRRSLGPDDFNRITVTQDEADVSHALKAEREKLESKKTTLKQQLAAISKEKTAEITKKENEIEAIRQELNKLPKTPFALRKSQLNDIITYCALTDTSNEYLGDGYPNLFTIGAMVDSRPATFFDSTTPGLTDEQKQIPARTMLAIVIASALDKEMEVHMTREDKKKYGDNPAGMEKLIKEKYGSREQLVEHCITNVIGAINNARRSHNADTDTRKISRMKDNHTCVWGGEGVLLQKGNTLNKIIAKPPKETAYDLIPGAIENFITAELRKADDATRKAFYNFTLKKHVMGEEVDAADAKKCDAFLANLKRDPKKIYDFLLSNLEGLPRESRATAGVAGGPPVIPGQMITIDGQRRRIGHAFQGDLSAFGQVKALPTRVETGTNELFDIYVNAFKSAPEYTPSSQPIGSGVLAATHEVMYKDLQDRLISEKVLQHQDRLQRIMSDLTQLKRVVDSDKRRGLLAPHYLQSTLTEIDLQILRSQLEDECNARFKVLPADLTKQIAQEFKDGILEIATGLETPPDIRIHEIVKPLERKFDSLFRKINDQISDISHSLNELDKLFDLRKEAKTLSGSSDISINEIKSSLPSLPNMRVVPKDSSPLSWALSFVYYAFEKDPDTNKPVRDAREIGRLIDIMLEQFNSLTDTERNKQIDTVLKYINIYLKEYQLPPEPNQPLRLIASQEEPEKYGARLLLTTIFKKRCTKENQQFDLTRAALQPEPVKQFSTFLLTRFNHGENVDQPAVNAAKLSPTSTDWQKFAKNIIGTNRIEDKFEEFFNFILLTIFSKLNLTEIQERDANTIRKLAAMYLGIEPLGEADKLAYPPDGHDLYGRIILFGKHINDLIISLAKVKGLFNSGAVSIISQDEAQDILLAAMTTQGKENVEAPCCVRVSIRYPGTPLMLTWLDWTEKKDEESKKMVIDEYTPVSFPLNKDALSQYTSFVNVNGQVQLVEDFHLKTAAEYQADPDYNDPMPPRIKTPINVSKVSTLSTASNLTGRNIKMDLAAQNDYQEAVAKENEDITRAIERSNSLEASGNKFRQDRYRTKGLASAETKTSATQVETASYAHDEAGISTNPRVKAIASALMRTYLPSETKDDSILERRTHAENLIKEFFKSLNENPEFKNQVTKLEITSTGRVDDSKSAHGVMTLQDEKIDIGPAFIYYTAKNAKVRDAIQDFFKDIQTPERPGSNLSPTLQHPGGYSIESQNLEKLISKLEVTLAEKANLHEVKQRNPSS